MSDNLEVLNDCSCPTCCHACTQKPGWFLPGEAEKVAEFLGISLRELFDTKLGADWWGRYSGDILVLAPAVTRWTPGVLYDEDPKGQCVFYDPESQRCTIHPVKPFECRTNRHDTPQAEMKATHKSVAFAWDTPALQQQVISLIDDF